MKSIVSKKFAIITAAVLIVLAIAAALILPTALGKTDLEKQLDLGQRCLVELDYEGAILAFERAIEIDPNNADAYIGLAEAYLAADGGKTDNVHNVLAQGYAATGSEDLVIRFAQECVSRGTDPLPTKGALTAYDVLAEKTSDPQALAVSFAELFLNADNSTGFSNVMYKNSFTPQGVDIIMHIANLLMKRGDYRSAIDAYDMVIGAFEQNVISADIAVNAYLGLADAYMALGNEENAISVLEDGYAALDESPAIADRLNEFFEDGYFDAMGEPPAEITDAVLGAALCEALSYPEGTELFPYDLEQITVLDLRARGIEDITPLKYCLNLKELYLDDNNIRDLSPLSGLQKLMFLSLNGNRISDLSPLASLPALSHLLLSDNAISDLTPIADIGLMTLSLANNRITDISPLASHRSMTFLNLNGNAITDISAIAAMAWLNDLYLANNSIFDLSPLSDLAAVREPYLNLNLYFENNLISDLSPLASLTGIMELDLRGNPVTDWSPVSHIENVLGRPESSDSTRLSANDWYYAGDDSGNGIEYMRFSFAPDGTAEFMHGTTPGEWPDVLRGTWYIEAAQIVAAIQTGGGTETVFFDYVIEEDSLVLIPAESPDEPRTFMSEKAYLASTSPDPALTATPWYCVYDDDNVGYTVVMRAIFAEDGSASIDYGVFQSSWLEGLIGTWQQDDGRIIFHQESYILYSDGEEGSETVSQTDTVIFDYIIDGDTLTLIPAEAPDDPRTFITEDAYWAQFG